MNFTRVLAIFIRQLYLVRSNPTRLGGMFLWVLISIVQWGFISKYIGSMGRATFSFITVILGAIILWETMSRIQQGIMTAFLEDVWSQNFLNFFASPIRVTEYVGGLLLTSLAIGSVGFTLMVVIAGVAFGYNFFTIGTMLLPFILILLVFGTAMGIFVSGMIFRFGPTAEWLGWPIPLLLSIVSGVFYPIPTLPMWLQYIAKLIPPAYVFTSMRSILATKAMSGDVVANLGIGAVLAVVYLILGYLFFVHIYKTNMRNGSIVRFSAEAL